MKKRFIYSVVALIPIISLIIGIFIISEKWHNFAWKYRQTISMNTNKLIKLHNINSEFYEKTKLTVQIKTSNPNNPVFIHARDDGSDILFTSLSDRKRKLHHRIEKYINTEYEKELIAWVELPGLMKDHTYVFMYYGNNESGPRDDLSQQSIKEDNLTNSTDCIRIFQGFGEEESFTNIIFDQLKMYQVLNKSPEKKLSEDRFYISDTTNHRIQVFDAAGNFLFKWGRYGSGNGEFKNPQSIVIYENEVFISDRFNERIQVFDLKGNFKRKWGIEAVCNEKSCEDGTFDAPRGLEAYEGEIYVVDTFNHRIQVFDVNGKFKRKWGSFGKNNGGFNVPLGIQEYNNEIYVVDAYHYRIQVFDKTGKFIRKWGRFGCGDGEFDSPLQVTIYNDEVFVTDRNSHRIQVFDTDGNFLRKFGAYGSGKGYFKFPYGIALLNDKVYVADRKNHRIQILDRNGIWLETWGSLGNCYDKQMKPYKCNNGEFEQPLTIAILRGI